MTETHIVWSGSADEVVEVFGQQIRLRTGVVPTDPVGTLYVGIEGSVLTPVTLPNSTSTSPAWSTIPGTSPVIQARQDGHYPMDYIRVRFDSGFATVAPGTNVTQGTKVAATALTGHGKEVRMRGTLVATGVVSSGAVIGTVSAAHFPLAAQSTQVRYTGGGARLQILTNGTITLGTALALNDNVWLDSLTYDLLA
jgi:hypothetical protein